MKNFKRITVVIAVIVVITAVGAVFAAELKTPAEIVSGLTGKTIESLNEERAAGKTYGTIANEAGKLDEFKAQMLEQKKAILDQRVADGSLTREKADEIYNALKENMASCDGTGSAGIGRKYGAGFKSGACGGIGKQAGGGMGMRRGGTGRGMGFGRN
jgi:hypothetical protein